MLHSITKMNSLDISETVLKSVKNEVEAEPRKNCCVRCGCFANSVCQRCDDYYCSESCQTKDWHRHRYICFPMPALVKSANSLAVDFVKSQSTSDRHAPDAVIEEHSERKQVLVWNKHSRKFEQSKKVQNDAVISEVTPTPDDSIIDNSISDTSNSCESLNAAHLLKKTPPLVKFPPDGSIVFVTGFRSPNRCNVRDANEAADKAYIKICKQINAIGKGQAPLQQLYSNQYALAKHDGRLKRVQILATRNDRSARVFFLEHGYVQLRQAVDIFEINDELLQLPCYSRTVQLKGVQNYAVCDELNVFLSQFENQMFVARFYSNDNIELIHMDTQKSLNARIREFCADKQVFDKKQKKEEQPAQMIGAANGIAAIMKTIKVDCGEKAAADESTTVEANEANVVSKGMNGSEAKDTMVKMSKRKKVESKPKQSEKEAEITLQNLVSPASKAPKVEAKPETIANTQKLQRPVLSPPFDVIHFDTTGKDGLDVFILDNSSALRGIIAAFDVNQADDYVSLDTFLSNFRDPTPYAPVLNEYVIAKFHDLWYRAKIIEIKDNPNQVFKLYNVMYVDFTNLKVISGKDIRRYPDGFRNPCHTNICLIEGFPAMPTENQKVFLEKALRCNNQLHIDSFTYIHDMALVRCDELLSAINENK